jgi:hypothetical protein
MVVAIAIVFVIVIVFAMMVAPIGVIIHARRQAKAGGEHRQRQGKFHGDALHRMILRVIVAWIYRDLREARTLAQG